MLLIRVVKLFLTLMIIIDANLSANYLSAFVCLVNTRCTKNILIVDLF